MSSWVAITIALTATGAFLHVVSRISRRERELGRFDTGKRRWWKLLLREAERWILERASRRDVATTSRSRETAILRQAGLDSIESRERYYVLREVLLAILAATAAVIATRYEPEFAIVVVSVFVVIGWVGPRIWLQQRRQSRQQWIDQEIPLVIALLHAGTTTGRDAVHLLDQLADNTREEATTVPVARELGRAQWYARMGGTWEQGFQATKLHLSNESAARAFEAVSRALSEDSASNEVLGIAAQEYTVDYRARLEVRLAELPAKVAVVFLVMVMGCACVVMCSFGGSLG